MRTTREQATKLSSICMHGATVSELADSYLAALRVVEAVRLHKHGKVEWPSVVVALAAFDADEGGEHGCSNGSPS